MVATYRSRITTLTTEAIAARIQWLTAAEGGRQLPPSGLTYSTVARFELQGDTWASEAWSLVLDFMEPPDDSLCHLAKVRFLAKEGPLSWLHEGSRFQLMEGPRVVANGLIVPT